MLKDFQYHNFKLINIKIYHKIKYKFEYFILIFLKVKFSLFIF